MAFLLPENLPSSSEVPQAVRDMAAALRDHTDDSVTVWLDRAGGEPYLVVFDPSRGVLLLHVVQGGARGLEKRAGAILRRAQPTEFDEVVAHLGPIRSEIMSRIGGTLRDVPVEVAIAAPAAPRANAERIGVANIERYLLKEDCSPDGLQPALARVLSSGGIRLSEIDERRVRAAIYPELVIHDGSPREEGVLFQPHAGEDVIAVLDREQERLARHLGDGYRVIKGVAGSGKTLVLTFRARFLAEAFPTWRVLLACYNRVLADALAHDLADLGNVTVATVDSMAFRICKGAGVKIEGRGDETFRRQRTEALRVVKQRRPPGFEFDVVLLDEAQDLDDTATEFVYHLLADGREQFVIALDAAQNIYRRSSRWTPPGTSGRGRTKILRLNYRNTREILEVAYDFLLAGQSRESTEAELDDPDVIVPPEASARRGERPRILQCGSQRDALEAICDDIEKAHAEGMAWGDMAVMFGNASARKQMYHRMRERGIPWFDLNFAKNKSKAVTAGDVVRGSTFQSLKGLEYRRVYITGVDRIEAGEGADDETKRRLLYVGMTRATDYLMIALYGGGPLVESLLHAAGKV